MMLQIWRKFISRYPWTVLEKDKLEIFIDNLNDEMSCQLKLQYLPSFQKLIDNGIQIEEALIKKGVLKFSKEGASSLNNNYGNNYYNNNNSDKSKF